MRRQDILQSAADCVSGRRQEDYGSPEDSFGRTAKLWTAYKGVEFTAVDVAVMMIQLKIARITEGRNTEDSWVDVAGYAACGGEISTERRGGNG